MNKNPTILVVEDDPDIRDSLVEFLQDSGFAPRAAENGLTALAMLRAGPLPDLILLDLMMPVLDGFGFREEQLRDSALAAVPVVVMSADGNIQQKQSRIGAADYLKKPLDIHLLVETLHRHLGLA